MSTINFRNAVQAALFSCELQGQISDGMWENTNPHGHWRVWRDANINVHPTNVGVNFYARKNNYNFTSKELLSVIGDRMLNIANMAENNVPLEGIDRFNDYDPDNEYEGEYWEKKRIEFFEYFPTIEDFRQKCSGSYDMEKLKDELEDMKKIIKIIQD